MPPDHTTRPGDLHALAATLGREQRMRLPTEYAQRLGNGLATQTFPPNAVTVALGDAWQYHIDCGHLAWRVWWDDHADGGLPIPGWYLPGVNWHIADWTDQAPTPPPLTSVRTLDLARAWAERAWLVRFGIWERISPR